MSERLDIVIFGASGFTGKHAVETANKLTTANGRSLTYGVAGRSRKKIETTLTELEKRTGINFEKVPIIEADVKDEESLRAMAKRARVIINCCGPYRFYGEPVIRACIEEGTHHIDVSGEPQYMESMQLKYHKAAEEKGVYVVSACGFDSIPADLGLVFLKNNFPGTLHSVEAYLETYEEGAATPGPSINFATWESAVYGLGFAHELKDIRKKLFPQRLPELKPKLKIKTMPHKSIMVEGWALPFPGSDRSVMCRSQRHFYEQDKERPVQVQTYFMVKSFWQVLLLIVFGGMFSFLSKFSFGRQLLLKYPSVFSFGMFTHEPPSEEKIAKTKFRITFQGQGWRKLSDPLAQCTSPPDAKFVTVVEGANPGYGTTTVCCVLAAIITLTETDVLPSRGGVYPPGAAFGMSSLISQLDENGLRFIAIPLSNL